jgi:hypothetical protein
VGSAILSRLSRGPVVSGPVRGSIMVDTVELDDFRRILDHSAAAYESGPRVYLVTMSEGGSPELRELLDSWMIGQAQAYAAEGWQHTIFAVFEPPGYSANAIYSWTLLAPEKVENCADADDARKLCDDLLERLYEQRSLDSA